MYPVGQVTAEAVEMGGTGVYSRGQVLWLVMHVQKCYAEDTVYSNSCTSCFSCFELRSRLVGLFSGPLDYVNSSAGVVGVKFPLQ